MVDLTVASVANYYAAFMRKALKRHGSPEMITTDGLRSYKAAMSELQYREAGGGLS